MTVIKKRDVVAKEVGKQQEYAPLGQGEAAALPQTKSPLASTSTVHEALKTLVDSVNPPHSGSVITPFHLLPLAVHPRDLPEPRTAGSKGSGAKGAGEGEGDDDNAQPSGQKDKGKGREVTRVPVVRTSKMPSFQRAGSRVVDVFQGVPDAEQKIREKVHEPVFKNLAYQVVSHRLGRAIAVELKQMCLTVPKGLATKGVPFESLLGMGYGSIFVPLEGDTLVEKMVSLEAP